MPLGLHYTIVKTEELARTCGHKEIFEHRDPDPWSAQRREKFLDRACRSCVAAAIALLEKAAGGGPPRLPYGDVMRLTPAELEELLNRHAFKDEPIKGLCHWRGSREVWRWFTDRQIRVKGGYNPASQDYFFSFRVELDAGDHEWIGANATSLASAAARGLLIYVCRSHPRQQEARWEAKALVAAG